MNLNFPPFWYLVRGSSITCGLDDNPLRRILIFVLGKLNLWSPPRLEYCLLYFFVCKYGHVGRNEIITEFIWAWHISQIFPELEASLSLWTLLRLYELYLSYLDKKNRFSLDCLHNLFCSRLHSKWQIRNQNVAVTKMWRYKCVQSNLLKVGVRERLFSIIRTSVFLLFDP